MPFIKYQNTNNANSVLIAGISAISTTILIKDGDQNLFPSEFPFLLTLEHKDGNGNVILREIVKAISQNQNTYIVERGAGMCVQDDTASNRIQDNTTHAFESGDSVSLYRTSEQVKEIQDKLESSVNDPAIADEYDSTETYAVGDTVMYKGDRYQCTVAVETAEDFDSTKRTKISVQYELKQAQEDIVELQNRKSASDHLEESGLVGELYTLEDKLFKQNTPTLDDSTIDCNVGDVANNTQIHIQRQGSGVASNELKLKVKSVGSPTTGLVVEVRKGVQVTVTENVEAYWYGDENEIIATGSIAYGDITNTYAEFTITLDNEFGGTEGELLDIVVYQTGSIVNATNYYSIACDSTQYSEAFSYVSVNGSTMTRSKLMPYAISDGFAQSLLCKTEINDLVYSGNPSGRKFDIYTEIVSIPRGQNYYVEGKIRGNDARPQSLLVFYVNGGYSIIASVQSNMNIDFTATTDLVSLGDSISFRGESSGSSGYLVIFTDLKIYRKAKKGSNILDYGTPSSIRQLGDITSYILFGIIDGTFTGGKMIEKTTSATTGSVSLGNAVGFIKVNLNGEIVKIPYYNE